MKLTETESWVSSGNWLILSRAIDQTEGKKFNIEYKKSCGGESACNPIKITDNYYNDPDPYFKIGGDKNNPVTFSPLNRPYISNDYDAENYFVIGKYKNQKDGIARWQFGQGNIYYFADTRGTYTDPFDPEITLSKEIVEMIERIIGVYVRGYFQSIFKLTPLLNAQNYSSTDPFILSLEHLDDPSVFTEKIEWAEGNDSFKTLCTQVDGSVFKNKISDKPLDNCKVATANQPSINTTDLTVKITFKASSATDKSTKVDFEKIKICYER